MFPMPILATILWTPSYCCHCATPTSVAVATRELSSKLPELCLQCLGRHIATLGHKFHRLVPKLTRDIVDSVHHA